MDAPNQPQAELLDPALNEPLPWSSLALGLTIT